MILIGAGNLGAAIANYVNFEKFSFRMIGLFDVSEKKIGNKINNLEIYSMEELPKFLKEHRVDIAALTIPKEYAPEVAKKLVDLKVEAIWNFAHVDLEVPENVVVQNVHLSDSLMQLSYNITQK